MQGALSCMRRSQLYQLSIRMPWHGCPPFDLGVPAIWWTLKWNICLEPWILEVWYDTEFMSAFFPADLCRFHRGKLYIKPSLAQPLHIPKPLQLPPQISGIDACSNSKVPLAKTCPRTRYVVNSRILACKGSSLANPKF